MLVYGDRVVCEPAEGVLARIRADLDGAGREALWILRHERLARALIEAGRLAQGLADAAFEARGCDGPEPAADWALSLTRDIAEAVIDSWSTHPSSPTAGAANPGPSGRGDPSWVAALHSAPAGMTEEVGLKSPEGYAFYAVYPESYALAAEGADPHGTVIGLRSIGTSLGAMVAAAAEAKSFMTLRPCGHPFAREIKLCREAPSLGGPVAIVDEGPGLSGSSFGAAADFVEAAGIRAVSFFPSHLGDPGPMASEPHRRRWADARRLHVGFEALALDPGSPHPLAGWFADLVGAAVAPLEDLSGGGWRRGEAAPVHAQQERRKFRLTTRRGDFLLKFAGLGVRAAAKLERAQALHAAGFTPEPLALRHGFLLERWHGEARPLQPADRPALLETLGRYLAFRAARFPARPDEGATPAELARMAAYNAGQLLDAAAAERAGALLAPLRAAKLRPVRIDGRLHAWEWRVLPDGRILKTDALDHDDAHDLVGCQDIAWDVAGAGVELDLSTEETLALGRRCGADPGVGPAMRIAYLAFQAGAWTLAAQAAAPAERDRIATLVLRYRTQLVQALNPAAALRVVGPEEPAMPEQPDLNPGDEAKPGTDQSGEHVCPRCSGSGRLADGPCPDCGGSGKIIALVGDA